MLSGDYAYAFTDEARSFPKGSHDDQIDAVSQGIQYLVDAPRVSIGGV